MPSLNKPHAPSAIHFWLILISFNRPIPPLRSGGLNLNRFGVNAHSSHRFGLSAQTAPALTRRLPFSPGCVLRLCLLDFKAVIFAYHKLHSRLLAHHRRFKRGTASMAASFRGFLDVA